MAVAGAAGPPRAPAAAGRVRVPGARAHAPPLRACRAAGTSHRARLPRLARASGDGGPATQSPDVAATPADAPVRAAAAAGPPAAGGFNGGRF